MPVYHEVGVLAVPYVPQFRRDMVEVEGPANAGELCYQLYRDCIRYMDGARAFNRFAEVLGAIEAAKNEYYLNVVRPYEVAKREENGDVA